ncbi:hypothetical protein, partial [Aphanothece microscopica]
KEPGEQSWRGSLSADGEGGYRLTTATDCWPVITLEPALHRWLEDLDGARTVTVVGCCNPWGPWLRISRLDG